jgi:hypothetical protein
MVREGKSQSLRFLPGRRERVKMCSVSKGNAARSLPLPDQKRLRQLLAQNEIRQRGSENGISQFPQRETEMRWLKEHEAEYAGQWLALDGDRLVAHGTDAKQVYRDAFAAGVETPFVVCAEDPQTPQWGGW